MLRIHGLTRRFGARTILQDLDLSLQGGDWVAVLGESGAGKSTLLNLIAGLDRPDNGRIEIAGRDITEMDDDECTRLRRASVGFVFQAFHVLPHLSVAQNIELPLVLLGWTPARRRERVQARLTEVGLADRAESAPAELSGGELQRVAVARALAHDPALVLADEPTGNLDPDTAACILELLASSVRTRRAAGILVTHSAQAAAGADRVLRLERGCLTQASEPQQARSRPQ